METLTSNPRFARGIALARKGSVRELRHGMWSVNSATHTGTYLVDLAGEIPGCTCPDFEERGGPAEFRCKHTFAALITSKKIEIPTDMDAKPKRPTDGQHWPSYEAAQLHERERFEVLLRDLCGGIVNPVHKTGRPRAPLADIVFYIALRAYTGMSTRRTASDVRTAKSAGLVDMAVSPKTLNRYLKDPSLAPLLRKLVQESASPLAQVEDRFAVDSSGFSTCTYQRWFDVKHGREQKKARWVKAHICAGVVTNVVTDVLVTDDRGADAPQLPELVNNTATRFTVSEVSGDKAYMSRSNFAAVQAVGGVPYIPFRKGTTDEGSELAPHVGAVHVQDRGLQAALSRAVQRRDHLRDGQGQVRRQRPGQDLRDPAERDARQVHLSQPGRARAEPLQAGDRSRVLGLGGAWGSRCPLTRAACRRRPYTRGRA